MCNIEYSVLCKWSEKMKILIVRNYPNYMAVGKNATYNIQELGLASALVRSGHICDIVFWTDKKEEIVEYPVPKTKKYIKIYYRNAKTFLKNAIYSIDDLIQKYDIIQPCEYNQFQSLILAKKYPKKTVIYHGQYWGKENKKYNLWCSIFDKFGLYTYKRNKTFFITKSNLAKDYLVQKKLYETNIYSLGVGMNRDALDNHGQETNKICDEIEKIECDIKLLYVGEFMPRRHLKFIVKKIEDIGYKCKLVLIGKSDSEYGNDVKKYFKDIGIEENVFHVERIEQRFLSRIYKNCTAFLFPSTYEIFGMVLMEAMFFSIPVISSPNGGSSMLLKNGQNGYIQDNLNVDEWVETILKIKNEGNDISVNGRDTIVNHFTWDSLVEKFISVYEKRLDYEN